MADNDNKPTKVRELPWYLREDRPSLWFWIFSQMSMGAVYAALVFFGVVLAIFALIAVSNLLPENPYSSLAPLLDAARTAAA